MRFSGKCYCGNIRYAVEGEPQMKLQCHCRECQYISGGNASVIMGMPKEGFKYLQGEAKQFQRSDIENAVVREFCPDCGTHLVSRSPKLESIVLVKVGTLDDPSQYGNPQMAIFTTEKQSFHSIAVGLPCFATVPNV